MYNLIQILKVVQYNKFMIALDHVNIFRIHSLDIMESKEGIHLTLSGGPMNNHEVVYNQENNSYYIGDKIIGDVLYNLPYLQINHFINSFDNLLALGMNKESFKRLSKHI